MDIGKIIHDTRTSLGLTLEELGNRVGVGKSTVQKWENGYISNMRRDKIALLASALHINPISFIVGELIPEEKKSNYYRTLLSDKGLKAIRKQLIPHIEAYGIDKLASDLNLSFSEIKYFLTSDLTIGNACTERLDDILVILDTNIFQLIKEFISSQHNLNEAVLLFKSLDDIDQAEIRGTIKQMLKADKYKTTPHKQTYTAQIAAQGHGVENIEVNVDMDEVQKIYDDLD